MKNTKANIQQADIQIAQMVVRNHTECILLTKEEYNELAKYKGLYLDLAGSLETLTKQFSNS